MARRAFAFLSAAGFPVVRRVDRRYDVLNVGAGMTLGQVYEVYRRVRYWPDWPGATSGPSAVPQRLCGG